MQSSSSSWKSILIAALAVLAIQPTFSLAGEPPGLAKALEAQKRHTEVLMNLPGVVGTAVSWTSTGQPLVKIYTERIGIGGLPKDLDGVPVALEVTGRIQALGAPPCKGPNANDPECQNSGGGGGVDPTSKFQTPVPIGVSAGNMESIQQVLSLVNCTTGTLGARVKDSNGNLYALSNNHVFALSNMATPHSQIVQPGPADADPVCSQDLSHYNPIGILEPFESINFSQGSTNTIDAAMAKVDSNTVGNATPSDGYGIPQNALMTCNSDCSNLSNLAVQKYGRTTGLTKGTITGINVTISVDYNAGTTIFTDQIEISAIGKGAFIKSGDSGSLLVTDPTAQPVGLIFAGDRRGKMGFANRIDLVLNRYHVTIDGQ